MPRRRPFALLAALAVVACSAPAPSPGPGFGPEQPQSEQPQSDWQRTMKQVEKHFSIVETELKKNPAGDLRATADAATAAAALLRHGYGAFEDKKVPGFARMARDTESWLLQIALEARQAHGDLTRELFRGGKQHCTKCHDAAKVKPW